VFEVRDITMRLEGGDVALTFEEVSGEEFTLSLRGETLGGFLGVNMELNSAFED
jgi:hypothetical protein